MLARSLSKQLFRRPAAADGQPQMQRPLLDLERLAQLLAQPEASFDEFVLLGARGGVRAGGL